MGWFENRNNTDFLKIIFSAVILEPVSHLFTKVSKKTSKSIFGKARMLESLAECRTMFLFAASCKIGALERNAY